MSPRVMFTRGPFGYNGKQLDRGEIIELNENLPNNEKLIGLRYFLPYDAKVHSTHMCPKCSRKFVSEMHLVGHKKKPDCFADTQEFTKAETAELLGVEVDKVKVDAE